MGAHIKLSNISYSYDHKVNVLENINLVIPAGCLFGLVGANGSGKTTLLHILIGVLKAQSGQLKISEPTKIAYLPERPYYHGEFRLKEYLRYLSRISAVQASDEQIERSIEYVSLGEYRDSFIRTFSKGMLQRVGLAQAFLQNPELLIMDEPMSGLDLVGQRAMRDIIVRIHQEGTTTLLTSHNLYEIERLCTSVGILHSGELQVVGKEDLREEVVVEFEVHSKSGVLENILGGFSGVTVSKNKIQISPPDRALYFQVMQTLIDNGLVVGRLETKTRSLEEIALRYLEESRDRHE